MPRVLRPVRKNDLAQPAPAPVVQPYNGDRHVVLPGTVEHPLDTQGHQPTPHPQAIRRIKLVLDRPRAEQTTSCGA